MIATLDFAALAAPFWNLSCQAKGFWVTMAYISLWDEFMQLSLSPELEELIRANVASGAYASEEDVIRTALTLLLEHNAYLREEINRGIEQADNKIFSSLSIEDLKAEARRRLVGQKQ
ncbi:type II toxin-antitoxin system ParD family antitoxin [Aetokthonos hydrillicola Thurmond2011]|uniref:Type II toxin-antitoxin system ParD family antitoxin n=1 Tax=Aetokthonos hydrillicola Thurmond2011 TaxID=2712845 RepID=A0AAP5IIF0_9CYAN|nr:type II toxin-antitoxin system ParD family antitoxin [Aetokthonos hydrillicola]MDR9900958.1 type II toxin-antitoxin system ParD family antitoxin [Aetokthonos hydrillicola Thurmond2011]